MADKLPHQFHLGDHVVVLGWPPAEHMEVVGIGDRAMLTLRLPSGAHIKVGRRQCAPVSANKEESTT
jgi:hypothetical protein